MAPRSEAQQRYTAKHKARLAAIRKAKKEQMKRDDPEAYEKLKAKNRERYHKLKAAGKIVLGEERRAYHAEWRKQNRERGRAYRRAKRRALRQEVIAAYGGKCACCGESTLEFLAIDHINGGGRKHMKELGSNRSVFYRLIKKDGFPDTYRVLCHNCNQAYGAYGYCPHQGRPEFPPEQLCADQVESVDLASLYLGPATGSRNGSHTHPERRCYGASNYNSKLDEAKVVEILTKHAGGVSAKELAILYCVTTSTIHSILKRKTWRHVAFDVPPPQNSSDVAINSPNNQ